MNRLISLLLLVACVLPTGAQATGDSIVVHRTQTHMLSLGPTEILDTYLSPEKYRGNELRYTAYSNKPFRPASHLTQTMIHQGSFAITHNRANNNDELMGAYNFQYHVRYNWRPTGRLLLAAGGGPDLNIGYLYNTRNGNNPAQLRASLNVAPSAMVRYDFGGSRLAFRLGYEIMAPLMGVMFSPNYGQSYYEIFNEGNKDHNVVFTTIATTPSMRQMLTLDMRPLRKWSRTWLRIGYIGDYQQSRVNHLKYHEYAHLLMLGFTKGF